MPAIDSGACRPGRQGGVTVVDVGGWRQLEVVVSRLSLRIEPPLSTRR
jgi:hypothetical protein